MIENPRRMIIHSQGAVPNELVTVVPSHDTSGPVSQLRWSQRRLPLYRNDEMREPLYHIHPTLGERVDLATFPLCGLEETAIVTANSPQHSLNRIVLRPSLDVFVLGYPRGMSGGAKLPIWKRGTIATEPDFDLEGLPKFWIDTATREGMSGSPVYAQATGMWFEEEKLEMDDAIFGTGRRFAGIYSGRVGADPLQAQLGIVWKVRAIEETIEHSLRSSA